MSQTIWLAKMQLYYFNLNFLNSFVLDSKGSEFPDLDAAGQEARQIIFELSADVI